MRGAVVLRDDLTTTKYGYSGAELHSGSHSPVIVECTNCNMVTPRQFRNLAKSHRCSSLIGSQRRCYKCKSWKDLTAFHPANQFGGTTSICRACYNSSEVVNVYNRRRTKRLKSALADGDFEFYIKRRSARIASKAKCDGTPWEVDAEYLIELWRQQGGNCYYTGIKIGNSGKGMSTWDSPSLDRRVPELGYVAGNVVWCLFAVNSFKGSLSDVMFAELIRAAKWWCR